LRVLIAGRWVRVMRGLVLIWILLLVVVQILLLQSVARLVIR
jgi:hypothetical protein